MAESEAVTSVQSYLPGSASLIEDLDKRIIVVLRDGRTLIGYLRSIDQHGNILLQDTIERIHIGKEYGDIPRGIYIVRGENLILLGEIDPELEANSPLQSVPVEQILEAQQAQEEEKRKKKDLRKQLALKLEDDN